MKTSQFAAVILISSKGELVLQLRDDNPNIVDPGKLSLFAGRIEDDETPEVAASRELFEETTLKRMDLKFYKEFHKEAGRHGAKGTCYVYILKGVDVRDVDVHEGQGYRLVSDLATLNETNTALISLDIIRDYLANN